MDTLSIPLNVTSEHQAALEKPNDGPSSLFPVANPTQSFWLHSDSAANPLAKEGSDGPLTQDADICIIGSGITGVSAAYHLSRTLSRQDQDSSQWISGLPLKITILEARDFCSGATGRNGGHLTPHIFQDFVKHTSQYSQDEAIRAFKLEQYTASEIVRLVKDAGKEAAVDLCSNGRTTLLITDTEYDKAKAGVAALKAAGIDLSGVQFLTKEEVEQTYGASYPAIRAPGYNLWPLKLVTHLYNTAKEIGTRTATSTLTLHTNTPVTSITALPSESSPSRRWALRTARGTVNCTYVLHATNGYAASLLPHMRGPSGIVPTRGQVMALRASAPLAEVTTSGWAANDGLEYWFPRPLAPKAGTAAGDETGEETPLIILGGCREVEEGFEMRTVDDSCVNPKVGGPLRKFLPALFPGKFEDGREPEMEWTGIMGYTKVGGPFVGPVIDPAQRDADAFKGQYISAGYTGHGMPRAFACAEVSAQMILADVRGVEVSLPEWFPRHYLTVNRVS